MSTSATDYGEPWKVVDHSWSDSSIYNAKGKWLIGHSIDNDDTTEDNQEKREQEQLNMLGRIVSSVNACAGMDDPEKEIREMREANAELAHKCESLTHVLGKVLTENAQLHQQL